MKMIFNCHGNKTHFHNKGFALSLVLKVRFFGTRKWPINKKGCAPSLILKVTVFWNRKRPITVVKGSFTTVKVSLVTAPDVRLEIETMMKICAVRALILPATFLS